MNRAVKYANVAIPLIFIGMFVYAQEETQTLQCELLQKGVWASNGSHCITVACYEKENCGVWAYPAARCSSVRIGDHISQAYLQFGQPMRVQDEKLQWPRDKTDSNVGVEVTVKGDHIVGLFCPAFSDKRLEG